MTTSVNRETINDRFKLAFHRVVARRLKADPALLDGARSIVHDWSAEGPQPGFIAEWAELLARPAGEVRRIIVGRGEDIKRLRLSSPFRMLGDRVMDDAARMKLWRIVKKPFRAAQEAGSAERATGRIQ